MNLHRILFLVHSEVSDDPFSRFLLSVLTFKDAALLKNTMLAYNKKLGGDRKGPVLGIFFALSFLFLRILS